MRILLHKLGSTMACVMLHRLYSKVFQHAHLNFETSTRQKRNNLHQSIKQKCQTLKNLNDVQTVMDSKKLKEVESQLDYLLEKEEVYWKQRSRESYGLRG
ncbi:hypothetical protein ACOSP7_026557 [Xanthoceras sorbifolium]